MAKQTDFIPWTFDAVDQSYAPGATATVGNVHSMKQHTAVNVDTILFESGAAGGTYEVSVSAAGESVTGPITLGANSTETVIVKNRVRGIYIKQFGSDGTIKVFPGLS